MLRSLVGSEICIRDRFDKDLKATRIDDGEIIYEHLNDENNSEIFEKLCKEKGIIGVNGHRSVGGYRASLYNALKIDSVEINIIAESNKNFQHRIYLLHNDALA